MVSEQTTLKNSSVLWKVATILVVLLIIVAFFIYFFSPNKVSFSFSAGNMSDGNRKVSFRATSANNKRDTLYTAELPATVSGGNLSLTLDTPKELKGRSYIAEICVIDDGSGNGKCFTEESTADKTAASYSCPYLVNQHKSSRIANLFGGNEVNLDNRVACRGEFGVDNRGEMAPSSRIDMAKALENHFASLSGDGLLTVVDGKLTTMSKDELINKASYDKNVIEKTITITQRPQHYTTNINNITKNEARSQQLSIAGNVLSLSDGGSVTLPDSDTTYGAAEGLELDGNTFKLAQQGAANGQVLMWDGTQNKWLPKTPAAFSDTDDQTLSYNDTTHELTIADGNTVTFPLASNTKDGLLSKTDWSTFNGKENVLTFSDGLTRTGNNVKLMDCAAGKILQKGAAGWLCADQVVDTNATYSAGNGITIDASGKIDNTGVLTVDGSGAIVVDTANPQNPAISLSTTTDLEQVANKLGLTDTGVNPGTYNSVTVDKKGRVTAATNVAYLTTEQDAVIGNEVAGVTNNGGLVMTGAGTAANPYKVGLITTCSDGQLLKYTTASGWACANDIDTDTNTDQQVLNWDSATNRLTISGGNSINLSSLNNPGTDNQRLTKTGNTLNLENGGSVDLSEYKDNTDRQAISLNGNTLSISGNAATVDLSRYLDNTDNQALSLTTTAGSGNVVNKYRLNLTNGGNVTFQDTDTDTKYTSGNGLSLTGNVFGINAPTCTATQKLTWDGTSFQCAEDIDTDTNTTDTDDQTLSYNDTTHELTIADGNTVTFPLASNTKDGLLSKTDWSTFNGKENVLTFSDGLTRTGNNVKLMDCAAGKILQRNNTGNSWVCVDQVSDTNTTYSAGTGITINGANQISSSLGDNIDTSEIVNGTIKAEDLATIPGLVANTYNNVTVNDKGQVVAATNIAYLTTEQDAVIGNEVAGVTNNGGLVMTGAGTAANPYKVGLITTCSDGQLLKYTTASGWACANDIDTDTNTDSQNLSYNPANNQLTIAGGNTVDLSSLNNPGTDNQRVSLNGNTLTLDRGGSIDLAKYLDNTDAQALSLNTTAGSGGVKKNYTLSLTNGGNVTFQDTDTDTKYTSGNGLSLTGNVFGINAPTCTATQKLTWDGTSFQCAEDIDTDTDTNTDTQNLSISSTPGAGNVTKNYTISLVNGGSVNFQDTDTRYTAGEGIELNGTEFSVKCDGASAKIFCQNGNSFGREATLGTNDAFDLSFETSGSKKLTIDTSGNLLLPSKTTAASNVSVASGGTGNKYAASGSVSTRKPVIMRQYVWPQGTNNDWLTIRTGVSTSDYAVAMVGGYAFKYSDGANRVIRGIGIWTEKGSDGIWKIKADIDGVIDQWSVIQVAFFRSEISSHDATRFTFNGHGSTGDNPEGGYTGSATPTPVQ